MACWINASLLSAELKKQSSLAIPLIASWLLYGLSIFIATAAVARFGEEALAACVLVNSVWGVLTVVLFGTINAVSVLISREYGANRLHRVSIVFNQGMVIALLGSAFIMLVMWFFPTLLLFFENTEHLAELAKRYARSYLWCTPWLMVLACVEHLLLGLARTKTSLMIAVIEVPLEIFLVYVFVFGKFGFPALDVAGVGAGFTAAYALTTIVLIVLFRCIPFFKQLNIFDWKSFDWNQSELMHVFRVGYPIGFAMMIEMFAMFLLTSFIAFFGVTALAAHQIALQFLFFTGHIANALSQVVSIRVSYFLGQKSQTRLKTAVFSGVMIGLGFAVALSFSYVFLGKLWLWIDLGTRENNPALFDASLTFLMYLAVFQFFDSLRLILIGALRGFQDTSMPMIISLTAFLCFGILMSGWFGFVWNGKSFGCWMGIAAGALCSLCLLWMRVKKFIG